MATKTNGKAKPAKPRDMIQVRALAAVERIRARAVETGADRLSEDEIQAEVNAVRSAVRSPGKAAPKARRRRRG